MAAPKYEPPDDVRYLSRRGAPWDAADDLCIVTGVGVVPVSTIAKGLERTVSSVNSRMVTLGINCHDNPRLRRLRERWAREYESLCLENAERWG